MKHIKLFETFHQEDLPDFNMLPKNLQKFFKNKTGASLSKVIGNKNFRIVLEGEKVSFVINGKQIEFPFIEFIGDSVVLDKEKLADIRNYTRLYDAIDPVGKITLNRDSLLYIPEEIISFIKNEPADINEWNSLEYHVGRYIFYLIKFIREILPTDNLMNPFKDMDLFKNHWIKLLTSLGYEISLNPQLVKKGTISINGSKIKGFSFAPVSILPNGYIRRTSNTDRSGQLTTNTDLTRPIYTENDLNLKLAYVTKYLLKEFLSFLSLSKEEINKVISSIGEDPNSINYDLLAPGIVALNDFKIINSIKSIAPDSELWKSIQRLMGSDTAELASDMGSLGF